MLEINNHIFFTKISNELNVIKFKIYMLIVRLVSHIISDYYPAGYKFHKIIYKEIIQKY